LTDAITFPLLQNLFTDATQSMDIISATQQKP